MIRAALTNRSVNLLNLHYGLQNFAMNVIFIFLGVYLYQQGLSLPVVFLVWGSKSLFRIPFRILGIWLCFKRGLRKSMIFGNVMFPILFLCLWQIDGLNIWVWISIVAAWITDVLYWLPYHVYFGLIGDIEHRGKQTGIRDSVAFITSFLAPLLGGLIISIYGFDATFFIATAVMLLAVLPLLSLPDIPLQQTYAREAILHKENIKGMWLCTGWSIYDACDFIWKLVLFLMLGNFIYMGSLLSLAIVFQIVGMYTIGHFFDRGAGKKIYPIGLFIIALTFIGRTLFGNTIPNIIFLDILLMIGASLSFPIANPAYYNSGKRAPHPLWFFVATETGFDIGTGVTAFLAAAFVYCGGELRFAMIFVVVGLLIMHLFLKDYFHREEKKAGAAL